MFRHGFTTIGENFVNLVGIGALVFIIMLVLGGGDVSGDGVTYVVDLMKWFFLRIAAIFLIALSLVLGTLYAIAEVFSRRDYKPIPPRNVAYRTDGRRQLTDDIPIVDVMRLDLQDNETIEADAWEELP